MGGPRPLVIPPRVRETVRHLPPTIKRSIRAAIRAIGENPSVGEPLEDELNGLWKFRVRRYHVIYRVVGPSRSVRIYAVGERRSIYEEVAELLHSKQ